MKKIIFLFFLLTVFFATENSIRIHYHSQYETSDVITNQKFVADLKECTITGKVIEGDPCKAGISKVCKNTVITYTPRIVGLWGDNNNYITTTLPNCFCKAPAGSGLPDRPSYCDPNTKTCSCTVEGYTLYCPENYLVDYNTDNRVLIAWLPESIYNKYDVEHHGYAEQTIWSGYAAGKQILQLYKELGPNNYHAQTIDRYDATFTTYYNKKGYAAVFCKGKYEMKEGNNIIRSGEMPIQEGLPQRILILNNVGTTATFSSKLYGLDCFASVIRHPKDDDYLYGFEIQFNGYKVPPISNVEDIHQIEVVDIKSSMEIISTEVIAKDGSGNYLLKTIVKNTGDVRIKINETKADYLPNSGATPMDRQLCNLIFGPNPPAECNYPNGYNSYFNPGEEKTLYTLYLYQGESKELCDVSIMRLSYTSDQPTCSQYDKWWAAVNGPCITEPIKYPPKCEVKPKENTINPLEIHEWTVSCFDENNKAVACVGNNWRWEGIKGDFVTKTNEKALAYSTATSKVSGKIVYRQGEINCSANVTVDPRSLPQFVCMLEPSSAEMVVNETKNFDLKCIFRDESGSSKETKPQKADYAAVEGLIGKVEPYPRDPTSGVTFNATDVSAGKLRGIGYYTTPLDPTLRGAIAFSSINVGAGELQCGENETLVCHLEEIELPFGGSTFIVICECVPKEDNEEEDKSNMECVISPPNQRISPLQPGLATVSCYDKQTWSRVECGSDITWSINENLATFKDNTYGKTNVVFNAKPGATGEGFLNAKVGDNVRCEAKFLVSPYTCLEIS
ncbi:MAG: hypothetical protein QXF35_03040 [Candidatus Bilamarchaeaceae archaeon]